MGCRLCSGKCVAAVYNTEEHWIYQLCMIKNIKFIETEIELSSKVVCWQSNGKKGIRLCKEDIMCHLKLQ
jgi:hypothetical protein